MNLISEKLFQMMKEQCFLYPKETMAMIPELKAGTGFFPVGNGLWLENGEIEFPVGGVMILGQDFGTIEMYSKPLSTDFEGKTWQGLKSIIPKNILEAQCFFTNCIMGLRKSKKSVGKSPANRCKLFMEQCHLFFLEQLKIQRPKVIFALGLEVIRFLKKVSSEIASDEGWGKQNSIKSIDAADKAILRNITFYGIDNFSCDVAALMHPSMRNTNLNIKDESRKIRKNDKEIEIVNTLLKNVK